MINKTFNRIFQMSMGIALVAGMSSCNGSGTADKSSTDSLTTAVSTSATADSAALVKKAKKKKGQTSIDSAAANTAKIAKDAQGVYNRAEVAPEYPGGQSALASYVNNHLNYPQSAIDNDTTGTVHISFVVDEHGKVTNVHPMDGKNVGTGLADEATKVFSSMPMWTPGMVHGKKVKTRLEIPLTFKLADTDQ